MRNRFLRITVMLISAALGFRLFAFAYAVFSGAVVYPEVVATNPGFIAAVKIGMLLNILSGLFLIFWPFYLARVAQWKMEREEN